MPRAGIIMPATPGASKEVGEYARTVMHATIRHKMTYVNSFRAFWGYKEGGVREYEKWMTEALAEARLAPTTGDVPVAALLFDAAGERIGTGHNERELAADPTAHAEIVAIREAARRTGSWHLENTTLVVTLEPCTMCAGAILQARIPRVIFGAGSR